LVMKNHEKNRMIRIKHLHRFLRGIFIPISCTIRTRIRKIRFDSCKNSLFQDGRKARFPRRKSSFQWHNGRFCIQDSRIKMPQDIFSTDQRLLLQIKSAYVHEIPDKLVPLVIVEYTRAANSH
jgi:hypothetical protein